MACMSLEQGTLYYERFGSGTPIVILHDGLLDSSVWIPLAERLSVHNEVVIYDRRGFGHSDTPAAPYSNLDDLVQLLDTLGLEPAVLIGCSMGGGLGIDLALRHPEKVRGLFLIGAVISGYPGSEQFLARNFRNYQPLIERGDVLECIRLWSEDRYLISPGNDSARALVLDTLTQNYRNLTHDPRFMGVMDPPETALLSGIRVPVHILAGEDDIPDVHAQAGILHDRIPGSKKIILSGCGHLAYIEDSDSVNAKLEEFFSQC